MTKHHQGSLVRGFTLVEVAIVITIIAILAAIVTINLKGAQQDARDSDRSAKASLIADALEDYYAKNGEYPGCEALTSDPQLVAGDTLIGIDPSALKAPLDKKKNSNSLVCQSLNDVTSDDDVFSYYGDREPSCTSGDFCSKWELTYRKEAGGIGRIKSRHSDHIAKVDLHTPSGLKLAASMDGANAKALASGAACDSQANTEYRIRASGSSTSSPGSWSGWSGASTLMEPASQGWKYSFEAQARCTTGPKHSDWSTSASASVVRPISYRPASPVISVSPGVSSIAWSWSAGSCPAGLTTAYKGFSVGDWGYSSSWGEFNNYTSRTWSAPGQGYEYTMKVQAGCKSHHTKGPFSALASSAYIRPIEAPGHATGFNFIVINSNLRGEFYWNDPTCGPATIPEWHFNAWVGRQNPYKRQAWAWSNTGKGGWVLPSIDSSGREPGSGRSTGVSELGINSSRPFPPNIPFKVQTKYICVNPDTGRSSPWGPVTTSPEFKT